MRTLTAIFIISIISVSGFGQTAGTFAPTGSMTTPRSGHTATLLQNGKVLIAGGSANPLFGNPNGNFATAELYDPATRTFAATGNMTAALVAPTATRLADGRVLIVGGVPHTCCGGYLPASELYDPSTGTFSAAGVPPNINWVLTTATLLNTGKVLITGIGGSNDTSNFGAALYDPLAGTFTATGSMALVHYSPTATLLASGKVLIAEGICDEDYYYATGSELYDPVNGTFSPTAGTMPCTFHSTATLLPNGKVLIVDGLGAGTEVYDPFTETFTASAGIHVDGSAATRLPDGTVLISGGAVSDDGFCSEESVADADLYDPATGTLGSAGVMTTPRWVHQSTLLADGTVLISGGFGDYGPVASAEIYSPQTPQYFFSGEGAVMTSPFFYLQFPDGNLFGYYGYLSSSILYHIDLGYEAFIPSTADSIYFYDFASGHWWYSSASLFPILYDFTLGTWIYYIPDTTKPGHYTTNPRMFKNLTTGTVFPM